MKQKQFLINHKERMNFTKMIMVFIKEENLINQSSNRMTGKMIMNITLYKQINKQKIIEIEKIKVRYLMIIILTVN
jgi:hypothetical protein